MVTYTGTGSATTISGLGFQPDLIWAKTRSTSSRHYLVDSSRGFTKYLHPEDTYSEGTASTGVTSANSDGFVIGGGLDYVNYSGRTFVAWCWRAGGGVTSSNTQGDITSTVQANTKAGFSIVTYTGNGSSAQSIGHGLSSGSPECIFVKNRSQADDWAVYHVGIGNSAHLILNSSAAQTTSSAYWGSFTPTTTLFKVGSDHKLNASSENYVAYLWHGVEGYSKFGKYTGNGDADGPFIYTGFRPRLIFVKRIDSTASWYAWDTARSTFNKIDDYLEWDQNTPEETGYAGQAYDFLSNGFKARGNNNIGNSTGGTYIYGAWGDVPFKYNNTF